MMKLVANMHKAHLRPHFAYGAHYSREFESCIADGAYGQIKSPKAPNYQACVASAMHHIHKCSSRPLHFNNPPVSSKSMEKTSMYEKSQGQSIISLPYLSQTQQHRRLNWSTGVYDEPFSNPIGLQWPSEKALILHQVMVSCPPQQYQMSFSGLPWGQQLPLC